MTLIYFFFKKTRKPLWNTHIFFYIFGEQRNKRTDCCLKLRIVYSDFLIFVIVFLFSILNFFLFFFCSEWILETYFIFIIPRGKILYVVIVIQIYMYINLCAYRYIKHDIARSKCLYQIFVSGIFFF